MTMMTEWVRRTKAHSALLFLLITTLSQHAATFHPMIHRPNRRRRGTPAIALFAERHQQQPQRCRAQYAGVSVAPSGFHVLLQVGPDDYVPIQVTDDPADQSAATSPQALTLLQLLAQVDMAGAILPPDALSRLLILSAEDDANSIDPVEVGKEIVQQVQTSLLSKNTTTTTIANSTQQLYTDQHPWVQARTTLPLCTVDEVQFQPPSQFMLQCKVSGYEGTLSLQPTAAALEELSYDYHSDDISRAFTALALALRYRAPLVLLLQQRDDRNDDTTSTATGTPLPTLTLESLQQEFPMFRSMELLQQSSERSAVAVEQGFEIHKLQAALRIALEKGDLEAAAKIRAVLDEKDSLENLPVQPDSDTSTMQ